MSNNNNTKTTLRNYLNTTGTIKPNEDFRWINVSTGEVSNHPIRNTLYNFLFHPKHIVLNLLYSVTWRNFKKYQDNQLIKHLKKDKTKDNKELIRYIKTGKVK